MKHKMSVFMYETRECAGEMVYKTLTAVCFAELTFVAVTMWVRLLS